MRGAGSGAGACGRLAEDPADPGVDVLDVVDGVLARLLGREVDVDLDRLVVAAVDEEPAGEVDADLVDEVVEEDHVALALRHLRLLAAADEMDELVDQELDPRRVVAEHLAPRPRARPTYAVVVGAEDVDRRVEPRSSLCRRYATSAA